MDERGGKLELMRRRYERMCAGGPGEPSGCHALLAAKLLYAARQPRPPERVLRAMTEDVLTRGPLPDDVWAKVATELVSEGFAERDEDGELRVHWPYLEASVSYQPAPLEVSGVIEALERLGEADALVEVGVSFEQDWPVQRARSVARARGNQPIHDNVDFDAQHGWMCELLAATAYRAAARLGRTDAWLHLGGVLVRGTRRDVTPREVEDAYKQAVAHGWPVGALYLGDYLAGVGGRAREAEAAYRQALAGGIAEAHNNLGILLAGQSGREAEAEQEFGRAIRVGDPKARHNLALLLAGQAGREADAEAAYWAALEAGVKEARLPLGALLERVGGRVAEAEQQYLEAFKEGDPHALLPLGLLCARLPGRREDAETAYRAAIVVGLDEGLSELYARAQGRLGELLAPDPARREEGCEALRRARGAALVEAEGLLERWCEDEDAPSEGP
jgi:tetratricopeptide (TPR) repeat protein